MKRFLLVLSLLCLVPLAGCYSGDWSDPVHLSELTLEDQLILSGDGRVWIEFGPDLDFETVRAFNKPSWVTRGVYGGFSLPIYAADNEELYLNIGVPNRWDGVSDPHVRMDCWTSNAQDAADDTFRLQIWWAHYTPGADVVPFISTAVEVETTTGICAQYQSFQADFELDCTGMEAGDEISFRVRRTDVVTGSEMAGEIIISHVDVVFRCDKLGNPTHE